MVTALGCMGVPSCLKILHMHARTHTGTQTRALLPASQPGKPARNGSRMFTNKACHVLLSGLLKPITRPQSQDVATVSQVGKMRRKVRWTYVGDTCQVCVAVLIMLNFLVNICEAHFNNARSDVLTKIFAEFNTAFTIIFTVRATVLCCTLTLTICFRNLTFGCLQCQIICARSLMVPACIAPCFTILFTARFVSSVFLSSHERRKLSVLIFARDLHVCQYQDLQGSSHTQLL